MAETRVPIFEKIGVFRGLGLHKECVELCVDSVHKEVELAFTKKKSLLRHVRTCVALQKYCQSFASLAGLVLYTCPVGEETLDFCFCAPVHHGVTGDGRGSAHHMPCWGGLPPTVTISSPHAPCLVRSFFCNFAVSVHALVQWSGRVAFLFSRGLSPWDDWSWSGQCLLHAELATTTRCSLLTT